MAYDAHVQEFEHLVLIHGTKLQHNNNESNRCGEEIAGFNKAYDS